MADSKALEAQIQQKMRELEELRKDLERARKKADADYSRQYRELQKKYNEEVQKIQNQAQKKASRELERRLSEFQHELLDLQARKQQELERRFNDISTKQEKLIKDLRKEYTSLKSDFGDFIRNRYTEKEKMRVFALETKRNTLITKAMINDSAHEFFFPQQKAIIDDSMLAADRAFNNEMYEAAAAELSNMKLSYDLLAARVGQATDDWAQNFVTYCMVVNQLHKKLSEFRREPIVTCLNDNELMDDKERDYWSSGYFSGLASQIDDSFHNNVKIAKEGIVPYLTSCKREERMGIHEDITTGRHMNDEFEGIVQCIINEKYYSDERFLVGEQLTKYFRHNVGYMILKNGFIDNNRLESYEIEFAFNNKGQRLDINKVLLFPKRTDGMTTANQCIVYGDRRGLVEKSFLESLYSGIEKQVKSVIASINASGQKEIRIQLTHSLEDEKHIRTTEQQTKAYPDPQLQIRMQERKYSWN